MVQEFVQDWVLAGIRGWGGESNREIGFGSFRSCVRACERAKLCVRVRESVLPTARVRELQIFSSAVVAAAGFSRGSAREGGGKGGKPASQPASQEIREFREIRVLSIQLVRLVSC